MPRIPPDDLERLKAAVSLERLATAHGVALTRKGKDLHGKCPFHDDRTPSFVVDPVKNLWHCFGACAAGGDVIEFLKRTRGIGFVHAVELLRADLPDLLSEPPARLPKRPSTPLLPCPLDPDADDIGLLEQVARYYHTKLPENPAALAYLKKRGLDSPELIEHFQIGFADRTLGLTLPERNRADGRAVRGRLAHLGLVNPDTGHELYRGMLTIPTRNEHGRVAGLYGRRATESMRRPEQKHRNLAGPLRGLINREAFAASDEIILCEAPLDALTFWVAGYRNVTCAFGTNGFTDAHLEAFQTHKTRRVLIAYDRDDAGEAAGAKLAAELIARGIDCYRILFPRGMDANDFARKVTPATKSLGIAIRKAEWLGNGRPTESAPGTPRATATPAAPPAAPDAPPAPSSFAAGHPDSPPPTDPAPTPNSPATQDETSPDHEALPTSPTQPAPDSPPAELDPSPEHDPAEARPGTASLVPPAPVASVVPTPPAASPLPPPPSPPAAAATHDPDTDSVTLSRGDRTYRVRGLAANTSFALLRVNLRVRSDTGFHVDTLDLLQARQRAAFERAAATELGVADTLIHDDLGALLLTLEELQDTLIKRALERRHQPAPPPMTDDDRAAALALLRDPRLLERILADFAAAGIAGEESNALLGILAALSRKLERPLALIVQSTSAAGKSTLMDAILDFVPPEDRVQFSALTGQALFYMGEANLAHKILAVVEEEGAERASYALKLLQSEGQLHIASTGKDPTTGRLVTHDYTVRGPVMIFLTTTASDLDDELQNRCLILAVSETREQTQRIHRLQRSARTLEGRLAAARRDQLLRLHQNAQRLLAPLAIVNPYAERLSFPDEKTRTRRDHAKYLTLIDAIALLHQHQRPICTARLPDGSSLRYLRVTPGDIRLANRLADEALGRSLDELPPQTRRLLELLDALVADGCREQQFDRRDYRFTRRQVREVTGWGNTQLKVHLARLEDFEYLAAHRSGRGLSFAYELLYDGRGADGKPFLTGLIDPDTLETPDRAGHPAGPAGDPEKPTTTIRNRSAQTPRWSAPPPARSGPGRPQVGPKPGGGRTRSTPDAERDLAGKTAASSKNAHLEHPPKSYRTRRPIQPAGSGTASPETVRSAAAAAPTGGNTVASLLAARPRTRMP